MRLRLLELMAPFLLWVADRSDRSGVGRDIRAWLDADIRDAIRDMKRLVFALAVSRFRARPVRRPTRGGARPGTYAPGFRPRVAPSRRWMKLSTRAIKPAQACLHGRFALLRDLVADPERYVPIVGRRLTRLLRSRKGARFQCVAPPNARCVSVVGVRAPECADTS